MTDEEPHELWLGRQCKRWGTLPEAGGLFNQPLRTMVEMGIAIDIFDAFRARKRAPNAPEFAKHNPEIVKFCYIIEQEIGG